jgi:hypothetical protein
MYCQRDTSACGTTDCSAPQPRPSSSACMTSSAPSPRHSPPLWRRPSPSARAAAKTWPSSKSSPAFRAGWSTPEKTHPHEPAARSHLASPLSELRPQRSRPRHGHESSVHASKNSITPSHSSFIAQIGPHRRGKRHLPRPRSPQQRPRQASKDPRTESKTQRVKRSDEGRRTSDGGLVQQPLPLKSRRSPPRTNQASSRRDSKLSWGLAL